MNMYRKLFVKVSANKYVANYVEPDKSTWPREWSTTFYKEYKRFDAINLPGPILDGELGAALSERESSREFDGRPVTLNQLSILLRYSCGEFDRVSNRSWKHRPYPSGGARYPIEVYVVVLKESARLPVGVYHYNVHKNSLEHIPADDEYFSDKTRLVPFGGVNSAGVLLIMTAVWWRTENKYGTRGSRFAFIEAGHIAQNISLISKNLQLKCLELGSAWDDSINEFLRLDEQVEGFVHALILGH